MQNGMSLVHDEVFDFLQLAFFAIFLPSINTNATCAFKKNESLHGHASRCTEILRTD